MREKKSRIGFIITLEFPSIVTVSLPAFLLVSRDTRLGAIGLRWLVVFISLLLRIYQCPIC